MSLVTGEQMVTLYQTGDTVESGLVLLYISPRVSDGFGRIDVSFNNFLDAIDGSYCTFEGGDDPSEDGIYPATQPGGYTGISIYLFSAC